MKAHMAAGTDLSPNMPSRPFGMKVGGPSPSSRNLGHHIVADVDSEAAFAKDTDYGLRNSTSV